MKRLFFISTLSLIIILAGGLESMAGRWQIVAVPIIFKSEVTTMAGDETFDNDDGMIFVKDPGGSSRNFNPTGTFKAGTVVFLMNTADAAETITFDSTVANKAVGQNEIGIFAYDGTSWQVSWLGQDDTADASPTFNGITVRRDAATSTIYIASYHDTEATTPVLSLRKSDGTESSPGSVDQNAVLGTILFQGYDDDSFDNGARIYAKADANWGASERGTELYVSTRDGSGALTDQLVVTSTGQLRSVTSKWYTDAHFSVINLAPGGSGATQVVPSANTLGGYNLDADTEYLYFTGHMHSDWDAASDILIEVEFEVDVDNTGGNDVDVVVFDVLCYYKGESDVTNKTQSPTNSVIIGKSARYKSFELDLTIDHDLVSHVVDIGDVIAMRINFDVSNSDITDVVLTHITMKYQTQKVNPEI